MLRCVIQFPVGALGILFFTNLEAHPGSNSGDIFPTEIFLANTAILDPVFMAYQTQGWSYHNQIQSEIKFSEV
jgi:hypothetical protein